MSSCMGLFYRAFASCTRAARRMLASPSCPRGRRTRNRPFDGASAFRPTTASPSIGIVHRELVTNGFAVDQCESLDYFELVAGGDVLPRLSGGPRKLRLRGEVGGLDDERLAFPPAARCTSQPLHVGAWTGARRA